MFGVLEFFWGFEGAEQNWETHLFFHLPVSLRGVGRREGNENVGEVCAVFKIVFGGGDITCGQSTWIS